MIISIDPIIDRILFAANDKKKSIEVNEYISEPVRHKLKLKGYTVSEDKGTYIIKW